ncbi:dTDP-4-dehydrorhamnose 3,5-epimerase [Crateriforma conspicua]|uniref:dTDP-4-dehydrorhamnose 3,5-epimerase n=1 Tax=Crateriforma conspicua TaxID=2527996 RepID=A0A5C6FQ48_9PLAN|nr:dTDP-4-dehydrorhamnose 3,5-epimerase [Crateriforma conspicua]TWU63392.1 dTDP-4-dehydrorhamnose 3,5-epimerase [Crateriforma conspicua]
MEFTELSLPGVYLIDGFQHVDQRGEFVKTFHHPLFEQRGLSFKVREEFFSISGKHVLRGMHFQLPPHDHHKLVYCIAGRVLDVVLDLRMGSEHYGKHLSVELSGKRRQMLWIPKGLAHGFLSLAEDSCLIYKTDREHHPESDAGIRWDSFGMSWPCDESSVSLSPRDQMHPTLDEFSSPF